MLLRRLGLALVLAVPSGSLWAQSTQELQQQIQELRAKLDSLDQQLQASIRHEEVVEQEAEAKAKAMPSVAADNSAGLTVKSADGDFSIRFGADLQIDNRTFLGNSSDSLMDQILARRVRPTVSGTVFRYVDYYVRPDFGVGSVVLFDAYAQLNYFSRANLRVGKFKPPVGLERLQSDDDTNFIERGLPTLLVPSRDIGYQLSGDLIKHRVAYQVGVFNGVSDNSLSDGSVSDHRDYAGRIFLTPFLPEDNIFLSGLGIGIGATGGNVDGIPLPVYRTFGQNAFFTFAPAVAHSGHRTRLAPQAYYYTGPFGVLAEYTLAEEGFQKGLVRRDIAIRSWQVQTTYLLTGEKKGFGTLVPRRNFDPSNHGWGAVELAVRVSDFNMEPGIYNYGFASEATSPRRAHEWVGGVNWYLNRAVRISLDYGNTNFEGGAVAALGGNRPAERALLQRFQFNY
jgi:phosphate-selective porin OprO and OprP